MKEKRTLYFHEDDYCQQQLVALANAEGAALEMKKKQEFSDAHRAPGGVGWTAMYVRDDTYLELEYLKIPREAVGEIVAKILPPYDQVFTGYSTYREEPPRTAAWGLDSGCTVIANWSKDGLIQNIFFEFFDSTDAGIEAASAAVAALGARYPLLYIDWAWDYTCEAADKAKFVELLRAKLLDIEEQTKERLEKK